MLSCILLYIGLACVLKWTRLVDYQTGGFGDLQKASDVDNVGSHQTLHVVTDAIWACRVPTPGCDDRLIIVHADVTFARLIPWI